SVSGLVVRLQEGMTMSEKFTIKESGRNGTVEVFDDRIERTIKNRIVKDDHQMIPLRNATSVHQDRRMLGADKVRVVVGIETYEWKVKNAEKFVKVMNEKLLAL
ncbi:MAG: hypothetical protein QGM46_11475, partial [Actinomycetota bacterium]|nr:hypothetical protein [Actinomycetota bacterium]